jgi:hypothetical protein
MGLFHYRGVAGRGAGTYLLQRLLDASISRRRKGPQIMKVDRDLAQPMIEQLSDGMQRSGQRSAAGIAEMLDPRRRDATIVLSKLQSPQNLTHSNVQYNNPSTFKTSCSQIRK